MGFLSSVGNLAGFNNIKAPSKEAIQENMMFGKGQVKDFGKRSKGKWDKYMDENPYGKKAEAAAYGQQRDVIGAQTDSGVRAARESSGKYGQQDIGRRREDAVRRAGTGAQAEARRSTHLDYLNNRTAFDQFLLGYGLEAGQAGQKAQMDAMFQRNDLKNQGRQANAGAVQGWMSRIGSMGMAG